MQLYNSIAHISVLSFRFIAHTRFISRYMQLFLFFRTSINTFFHTVILFLILYGRSFGLRPVLIMYLFAVLAPVSECAT